MTKEPVYIVDIFRDIVTKVSESMTESLQTVQSVITGVHYMVGHYTEIQAKLQGLAKMTTGKFDRYPLVALFQDFVESRGDSGGYYGEGSFQLMIVYHTSKTDYTEDRYTKVFKPILYPIYEELLKQIYKNQYTVIQSVSKLSHEKIDRPHWGNPAAYGPDGYLLSDVLDGIEIRNLKITFNQKCLN
jgi:hypothetical protein